jgi:hypothetical protein
MKFKKSNDNNLLEKRIEIEDKTFIESERPSMMVTSNTSSETITTFATASTQLDNSNNIMNNNNNLSPSAPPRKMKKKRSSNNIALSAASIQYKGINIYQATAQGNLPVCVLLWGMAAAKRVNLMAPHSQGNNPMHMAAHADTPEVNDMLVIY